MADVRKTARRMFGIGLARAECIAAATTRLEAMGAVQDQADGPESPDPAVRLIPTAAAHRLP